MKRKSQVVVVLTLVLTSIVRAQSVTDCPRQAEGGVDVVVLDDNRPVPGATVLFTAGNWDSTLSQLSDDCGRVSVVCLPPGDGYEVTVLKSGYAASHVTTSAKRDRPTVRVVLTRVAGRYVRVTHGGTAVPGVMVAVTDSDGTAQVITTDENGVAEFRQLSASGDATIETSLVGFTRQRARIGPEFKNGPVVFEMAIEPVCTPMKVHSEDND